jgi:release factor glutamine methyltransferase
MRPDMTSDIPDKLRAATASLSGISDTARLDAELLMAHALGLERSEMILRMRDLVAPESYDQLIARRLSHEPVAYITGTQSFWDLELRVTPDVLIPRADSETLIEAAQDAFSGREAPRNILDLGTGSGALLLAALSLFPDAKGYGIDASDAALAVAKDNARRLGLSDRAAFAKLDWSVADWIDQLQSPFDLILCNPPYIERNAVLSPMVMQHEPHAALFAGDDGLNDYRILLPYIPALLAPDGVAVFEIGYNQGTSVPILAQEVGLNSALRHDLAGNPRCLTLRIS